MLPGHLTAQSRQVSLRIAGCVWRGVRYGKHFSRQKLSTTGSHEKTISLAMPPMSEQHHSNRWRRRTATGERDPACSSATSATFANTNSLSAKVGIRCETVGSMIFHGRSLQRSVAQAAYQASGPCIDRGDGRDFRPAARFDSRRRPRPTRGRGRTRRRRARADVDRGACRVVFFCLQNYRWSSRLVRTAHACE